MGPEGLGEIGEDLTAEAMVDVLVEDVEVAFEDIAAVEEVLLAGVEGGVEELVGAVVLLEEEFLREMEVLEGGVAAVDDVTGAGLVEEVEVAALAELEASNDALPLVLGEDVLMEDLGSELGLSSDEEGV